MIVVTGGAGFIGSNIIGQLNAEGREDIFVVDDLSDGRKFANLVGLRFLEYLDKEEFRQRIASNSLESPQAIIHQGACAVTTEWDGRYMMDVNYRYSLELLEYCLINRVQLIYASSAAVYGASTEFRENDASLEKPLNVYGYSKLLFDQAVRRAMPDAASQIVGLRYFNVYGPGESFKGQMASVALHLHEQLADGDEVRLFRGSDGYGPGEQRRDFVYVADIAKLNTWLLRNPQCSGIFNAGTGASATFNEVAEAVIDWHGRGTIRYIDFPEGLAERYQSYTQADMSLLRAAGYDAAFLDVAAGVRHYLDRIGARA
ncbi:MAG: ADP-glyceromanno-heptose 6-epimerase [Gammaproteobacteria bacterium]